VKAAGCHKCRCAADPDGGVVAHGLPPFGGATGRPAYAGDQVARWPASRQVRGPHRHASSPRPPARAGSTARQREPLPEKVASGPRHRRGVGGCDLSAVVHACGHGDPRGDVMVTRKSRCERTTISSQPGSTPGRAIPPADSARGVSSGYGRVRGGLSG